MAVINVPSSIQGQTYSVRIAGDAPTPEEQAKIDAYVAQMDSRLGGGAAAQQAAPEGKTGGIGSALGVGTDMLQQAYGSALEGAASSLGLAGLRDYGRSVADYNAQQIKEATPGLTGWDDVNSIGSGLSYFGQTLAQQVPQLGVSLAGAGAGALAGSAVPVVGTALGAIAGGALANLPFFYGSNRERQKEADAEAGRPEVVDEGAAFLSAIPQATLDAIVDRMLVGKLLPDGLIGAGNIFTRAVKGAGAGIVAEVPSEIGQQVIERAQAGLPIDSEDALKEYAAIARDTAILGGTVGSVSNIAAGDVRLKRQKERDEEAARQIEEDQAYDAQDILAKIGLGRKSMEPVQEDVQAEAEPTISGLLPPPTIGQRQAPTASLQVEGVDDAIAKGVSNLKVVEDGKEVPFKTFALSVDGDKAEVGFVEKAKGARKGVGKDAYVALGNELASRGITLQSTPTLLKDGNALWKGLEKSGNATYNPQAKRYEFIPAQAATAQTATPGSTVQRPEPSFRWKQYQAALEAAATAKAPTISTIQKATQAAGFGMVPPSVARDIRTQMERDGVIKPSAKVQGGYEFVPNATPSVDRAESYRRTLEDLNRDAKDARMAREKALQDARRAQQTGKKADYRKFMLAADEAERTFAQIENTQKEVQARLPQAAQEQAVPTTQRPRSVVDAGRAAVPITEAPPAIQSRAVSDRTQRLRQAMNYYQGQAKRQSLELRRLEQDRRKVQLPKSEIKRIDDLKASISEATYNAQQIAQRLARPAADIEADAAQQQAAIAKEAAAKVERAAKTPIYTQKEGQIFTALRKRLDNLGLQDVQLVAEKMLNPEMADRNAVVEGKFDVKDGNRMIAVSMGIYDPNMSAQETFDAISGVMNHEVIHALRNLGLFTDAEWKTLSDLAARQQYMKMKGGKLTQRGYTYLQRARQMYPDDTNEVHVEEAVAEMFRDYTAGRLKVGGRPKTLMDRIKDFFRAIWKSHEDAGITDPNQIFEGIRFGEIGKRQRNPRQEATAERQSIQTLPPGVAAEEEVVDPRDIVMPINPNAPVNEIKAKIKAMTDENVPIIRRLLSEIDAEFGTKSNDSVKDPDKVIQKATRPSILYRKPWHTVAHIRDTYRFQTQIDDFRQAPAIFQKLLDAGITIVKIDTNKLFNPTEWGWRIIAFDLRMPNGQLVEYQLPLKEMLRQKKDVGHDIYEEWRGKTQAELLAQHDEYMDAIRRSFEGYSDAFFGAMERLGMSPQEAEAAWSKAESSLLDAARNSRISSGVTTSSSDSGRGFQTPSAVRMAEEPSSRNSSARLEPSSTSANVLGMGGTSNESVSQGSVQDNLTPEQLDQVRYSIAMVRDRPIKGVGKPVNAPVNGRDGRPGLHYGTIMENGRAVPVLLTEGSHNDEARAGTGLAHIKARGHDKELMENSRYKSVEQAVYDLMYRWSQQGHQDGEMVVSYPYDGNITLEWRNGLTRNSPPLRLVLSHHNADGYPFYAVKTFFPVLSRTGARRYSVRTAVPLTDKERALTVLDRYEGDSFRDDRPVNSKGVRSNTRPKEQAVQMLQAERGNFVFDLKKENIRPIAKLMAAEAERALDADDSAIGWYDSKVRAAKAALTLMHPEIATDTGAGAAMDYATAVTSNGMSVTENYKAANEQYEHWKKTGTFKVVGFGTQGNSMKAAFRFYNALKARGMSDDAIANYLSQDTTVKALKADPLLAELGVKVGGKEAANAKVKVSFIMGPKIGQGFYQNLRGNFDPLTMDRWWMRFFNRLSGHPFKRIPAKTIDTGIARMVQAAINPATDYERQVLQNALESEGIDVITEQTAVDLAHEVNRIFQRDFKKTYDAKMAELKAQGMVTNTDRARQIAAAARPKKTELFKAADRLSRNTTAQLEESPTSGTHRQFMRDATTEARKILKDHTGVDINPADFQALMWYAEKRLWDSMGIRKGKGEDNDYVDGAIALLRSNGYSDEQIIQALPAGERFRIDPVGYSRGQDAGVRGSSAGEDSTGQQRLSVLRADADQGRAGGGDGAGRVPGGFLAPLEGAPRVQGASGPDPRLVEVAEKYAKDNGIDLRRQAEYVKVDPDRAARIAAAYDEMKHDPENPRVKAAYQELIRQTVAQYEALRDAGYRFWFMDPEDVGEYGASPWNAMRDLRANKSMGVFPTTGGFGTQEADISGNPLLAETGFMWPFGSPDGTKVPVLANDLFRAVHDAFGHGLEGSGFRADGEENAWQAHVRLFTGDAVAAITTETRGQNSWLNYGPMGEKNRNAKVEDTVFADQKTGLMPEWTWTEGRAADAAPYPAKLSIRYSATPITKKVAQKVQSNQKALMYARASDLIAKALNLKGYGVEINRAREFSDGVLRRFQDSMLPVGRMVQELSQAGMTITDAMDPYLQEELMHGVVGDKIAINQRTMFQPILDKVKALNVPQAKVDALVRASNAASGKGKGFVALALESYGSPKLALAEAYLYAKHARERNKYITENRDESTDKGSGMTDAESLEILRWFEGLDAESQSVVKGLGTMVREVVANTNTVRKDSGLISADVADGVEGANYKFYVPLRGRVGEDADDEFRGPPSNPRFGARGREDKKALGRSDYASDILANLFAQNQNAILRGERNKVGQAFLNLLRAEPEKTSDYAQILTKAPTMRASVDGKIREVPDPRAYDQPDILVVKDGGREVFVRFADARLAGALNGKNGMSAANSSALVQAMQKVNRYLASINTSYNPEFFITNMFRDLQTAGVNVNQYEQDGITKDVLGGLKGALNGIRRVIRSEDDTSEWSKVYKDFIAAGGQNATNQFNSLAEEMANIKTMLGDISESGARGQWAKVKNSFIGKKTGSLLQLVEDYNTIVENGIRVATYKALLDRGFTKQRAAQAARNVTVNFAKGGDYRQAMGAWYLFYNASIQGSFALLNAAIRSPKVRKLWASVIVMGLIQDQLNALLSDDDDDGRKLYDKIPDYVLEHNFVLPDPFGFTDRSYISIPMPYGLNMAHNAGRAISRAMRGQYSAGEATSTIFGTAVDALNPIGGFESWANFFAPTVVDPFVDIVENRDFADKPIFKESLPFDRTPAPDSQQYWSTTSPSAVWLANTMNELTGGNEVRPGLIDWSPDIMEFWFDYLTGGVGRFVQRSFELPMTVAEEGVSDELVRNIPFVRRTIGSVSDREDMGEYIEGAKRVLMAGEELNRARETGDAEWARQIMREYGREIRLIGPIRSLDAALRKIATQRNQIMDNPNMPEQQKRLILDRLDERKQMILSRANALLRGLG